MPAEVILRMVAAGTMPQKEAQMRLEGKWVDEENACNKQRLNLRNNENLIVRHQL